MTNLKISASQIKEELLGIVFPKYTTQIINLISNTAQATRSHVVGQMSDLVLQFKEDAAIDNVEEWKKWYTKHHPESIETQLIKFMINFRIILRQFIR